MGKSKPAAAAAPRDQATKPSNVTSISSGRRARATVAKSAAEAGKAAQSGGLAVVVFGKDPGGKAHASTFGAADAELAHKAAALMGFKVLQITSDEHRAAASGLPAGRIFASGRAFSPFRREAAYGALEAFPEAFQPPAPVEPAPAPPLAITGTPQTWDDIGQGSLVLASMGDNTGWFENVVVEARGDDLFVLHWRDWPDDPEFARRREKPRPAAASMGARDRRGFTRWLGRLRHRMRRTTSIAAIRHEGAWL